jgi:O-antigen/teichoic acid export membrane protein
LSRSERASTGRETGGNAGGASGTPETDPEAALSEALGTVAHGAVVSVPSLLCQRVLAVAFTAVLTNGFAAAAYGVFALARRIGRLLRRLPYGLQSGMNRYLPVVETPAERDHLITVTAGLFLGVATLFGAGLYLLAPRITAVTGKPAAFTALLRTFGVGLPVVVGMQTVAGVFRSLEHPGALNLTLRIGFPLASLVAAVVGTVVFGSTLAVAVGFVLGSGLVGLAGAAYLARLGVRLRLHGPVDGADAHGTRAYLRYVTPVFFARFFTISQRLGFYPVMALLLPGRASGVFTVGVVVGELVRLPLLGVNQFMSPVAAGLHGRGNRTALCRLYAVTSRLILFGVVLLGTVAVVYRREVMALFGPAYVAEAWIVPAFVAANLVGCAVGSVGILLVMTDHQHASLRLNGAIVIVTYAVTVPLTMAYGLAGVVVGFAVSMTINNVAEVLVLRRLEGLWPFGRAHLKPFVAAVPLVCVLVAVGAVTAGPVTLALGGLAGSVVYVTAVRAMGVDPVVSELLGTLLERYRGALTAIG